MKLSIIVQPLLRTLNVLAEGSVVEGKVFIINEFDYCSTSVVTILFTVQGECTPSTLKLNLISKAEQSITVQAPDNFVDEGTNTIRICNISHTLSSTDTNTTAKYMTQVSVIDDDVADVKVAVFARVQGILASVNELGPLCLRERT